MALKPKQFEQGERIITKGNIGDQLFLIEQGEVEVLDDAGKPVKVLRDGDVFGEVALILSTPRTATVRAKIPTDLYTLDKSDFSRILREHPRFAETIQQVAKERYNVTVKTETLIAAN